MNPLFIKLLIIAALVAGAFIAGIKVESNHRDAQLLTQERAYIAQYKVEVARGSALATALEEKRIVTRTLYKTITRHVDKVTERTVYRGICVDDDGVRLVNDALTRRAPASERDAALPAAVGAPRENR